MIGSTRPSVVTQRLLDEVVHRDRRHVLDDYEVFVLPLVRAKADVPRGHADDGGDAAHELRRGLEVERAFDDAHGCCSPGSWSSVGMESSHRTVFTEMMACRRSSYVFASSMASSRRRTNVPKCS